jgi:hypothetical protein
VAAFESGTAGTGQHHEIWSVCAVGVVAAAAEAAEPGLILEMHPELLSGWIDTLTELQVASGSEETDSQTTNPTP